MYRDGNTISLTVTAAINRGIRVTAAGAAAAVGDLGIGVLMEESFTSGDVRAVRHWNAAGTYQMVASGAISANARVYTAASGKISATPGNGSKFVGIALEAASADNDIIEVVSTIGADQNALDVEVIILDPTTLTVAQSGNVISTAGAAGTVTFTLPAATPGLEYFFHVGAAQQLRIDPNGTEKIALPSTGVLGAAGKYLVADAIGETVHIICVNAGEWNVFGFTGTWTQEA